MAKKTKRRMKRRETRRKYTHKKHTKKHMKVKKSRNKRGGGTGCMRIKHEKHWGVSKVPACPIGENCMMSDGTGGYSLVSKVAKSQPDRPFTGECMSKSKQSRLKQLQNNNNNKRVVLSGSDVVAHQQHNN